MRNHAPIKIYPMRIYLIIREYIYTFELHMLRHLNAMSVTIKITCNMYNNKMLLHSRYVFGTE